MISKTNLTKYIKAIEGFKKRSMSIKDLSLIIGLKEEVIKDSLIEFEPMINFIEVDLKSLLPLLKEELNKQENNKTNKKGKREVKANEANEYEGLIDYIYKNMCDDGGLLNLGYNLKSKDIKLINKILKKEKENLKK